MLEWIFWLAIAGTLALGFRYAVNRFFGPEEDDNGTLDKTEIRMQSAMRWFTAFWPNSSDSRRNGSN